MTSAVLVHWHDAASKPGWQHPGEGTMADCTTIGFLVAEDKEYIQLAQSVDTSDHVADVISIPKSCILSRKAIRT